MRQGERRTTRPVSGPGCASLVSGNAHSHPQCRAIFAHIIGRSSLELPVRPFAGHHVAICLYHRWRRHATFNGRLTVDGLPDEISTRNLAGGIRALGRWTVRLDGRQFSSKLDDDLRQTDRDSGLRMDGGQVSKLVRNRLQTNGDQGLRLDDG